MHKRMSRAIVALLALAIIASVLSPIVLAEGTVELFQNDNVIIDIDIYDPHDIDEFAESSEIGEVILNEAGVEPLNLDSVLTRGRAAVYIVMGRAPSLTTNGNIPSTPFTDVPINGMQTAGQEEQVGGQSKCNHCQTKCNKTPQDGVLSWRFVLQEDVAFKLKT